VIRITTAPIQDPLSNKEGLLGKVWRQWFSALDDSVRGIWGKDTLSTLNQTGITYDTLEAFNVGMGKCVKISYTFTNLVSTSGVITLPFTVEDGVLNLWDGATLIGGVTASSQAINLGTISQSSALLEGTLIIK